MIIKNTGEGITLHPVDESRKAVRSIMSSTFKCMPVSSSTCQCDNIKSHGQYCSAIKSSNEIDNE